MLTQNIDGYVFMEEKNILTLIEEYVSHVLNEQDLNLLLNSVIENDKNYLEFMFNIFLYILPHIKNTNIGMNKLISRYVCK